MAEDEERKRDDKEEIRYLKEENESLHARILYYED